jgi:hypothetical protein
MCVMIALAVPALADTLVLQNGLNGYAGTTDAWLDESRSHYNFGSTQSFEMKYSDGVSDTTVLKFDNINSLIGPGKTITSATLKLYYIASDGMVSNNSLEIVAYQLNAGKSWYENIYDGVTGYGVNWRYRDNNQSLAWSGPVYGGWNDSTDIGNGVAWIKPTGGSGQGYEPGSWALWNVTNSVRSWYAGAENNGFLMAAVQLYGNGSIAGGVFSSRNNTSSYPLYRPILEINFTPEPATLSLAVLGGLAVIRRR